MKMKITHVDTLEKINALGFNKEYRIKITFFDFTFDITYQKLIDGFNRYVKEIGMIPKAARFDFFPSFFNDVKSQGFTFSMTFDDFIDLQIHRFTSVIKGSEPEVVMAYCVLFDCFNRIKELSENSSEVYKLYMGGSVASLGNKYKMDLEENYGLPQRIKITFSFVDTTRLGVALLSHLNDLGIKKVGDHYFKTN